MADITKDLENDFCLCGRHAWRVHCPHCGSYHTYAYTARDSVTRQDGHIERLTTYRCRRCAARFNDDDWKLRCSAPNVILLNNKAGRRPSEDKPVHFESIEEVPEHMRNALEIIRKKRGIE